LDFGQLRQSLTSLAPGPVSSFEVNHIPFSRETEPSPVSSS
jgi:hypothetical protein